MANYPLLLSPNISSKLIVRLGQRKALQFYCYSPKEYDIELWTNLSDNTEWTGLAFTKVRPSEYFLDVNTSHLLVRDYEFTLRFKSCNDDTHHPWNWYGKPGENGIVRIIPHSANIPTSLPLIVPQLQLVAKEQVDDTSLWHYSTTPIKEPSCVTTSFPLGKMDHSIHSYVSLIQKGSTWLTPVAGHGTFCSRSSLERWQVLLYQDGDEGNIHLWMPMSQKGDCWLSPEQENCVRFHHTSDEDAHLLIVTTPTKQNFAKIIRFALEYYKKSILNENTCKTTDEYASDSNSILLDKLGYCTWNAFGKEINMESIQMAMESLQMHQIPVGYLLLDDGWQRVSNTDKLTDFEACSNKFPDGLKSSISQLKLSYPTVQYIGVWHILWGYWNGIDKTVTNRLGCDWTAYQSQSTNKEIGIANNPRLLYQIFYKFLEEAGIDFVKVDNQGSFQDLDIGHHVRIYLWDSYRQNMIKSADQFFNGRVFHCMALTPHILLNPMISYSSKGILRNSDDFFPDEMDSHSWHIYANAINSLLTSQAEFIGDWDMFQSDHPFAEYHASSRAISGGPIYITDLPYKHNVSLIQRLIGETRKQGYTILRSQGPPQLAFETVFGDPMASQSLLIIYNLQRELPSPYRQKWYSIEYSICGFWNTGSKEQLGVVTSELFCASKELWTVPAIAFVLSGPDQGKLVLLQPLTRTYCNESVKLFTDAMTARVNRFGSTLVSVSPVKSTGTLSIACLGLIDKFNGIRAIARTGYMENNLSDVSYEAILHHRSSACGFWINLEGSSSSSTDFLDLLSVQIDGILLKPMENWSWCSSSGLLTVNMMTVPLKTSVEDTFCIRINISRL